MNRRIALLVNVIRSASFVCFVLVPLTVGACSHGQGAPPPEPVLAPIHVATTEAREMPMPATLHLVGTLKGAKHTDLAANASGRVVETTVERGSQVEKGAVLARLDVRAAALSANEARANAKSSATQANASRTECERSRTLLQKGALSQQEYDRLAAQCQSNAEALEAAEMRAVLAAKNLGDGVIRAPFAGMVTERFVNSGEYVHEDSKVVSLTTLNVLHLELTVTEAKFAVVRVGQSLTFTVSAYPEVPFLATMKFIGGAVREATRDVVVEAEVLNADLRLRPGMFVNAEVAIDEKPMPAVLTSSLVRKGEAVHLFVVAQGRVEERVVHPGATKEAYTAIARGIKAGDQVVTAPVETLRNGQAVH